MMYTPPQIAKLMKVNPDKVITWIRSGELAAFNTAARADALRPRYKITEDALQAFIQKRTPTANEQPVRKPVCPAASDPGVIPFRTLTKPARNWMQ